MAVQAFPEGKTIEFTAAPSAGYEFTQWRVFDTPTAAPVTSTGNPLTTTAVEGKIVFADFQLITVDMDISVTGQGTISSRVM